MQIKPKAELHELSEYFIQQLEGLAMLLNLEYKYVSSKHSHDKYSGEFFGVYFENIKQKRRIYFELIPYSPKKPRISFTIYRPKEECKKSYSDYSALEGSGYLEKFAPELTYCKELNNFEGVMKEKISKSLDCIENKILIKLKNVLAGEEWINIMPEIYKYK